MDLWLSVAALNSDLGLKKKKKHISFDFQIHAQSAVSIETLATDTDSEKMQCFQKKLSSPPLQMQKEKLLFYE